MISYLGSLVQFSPAAGRAGHCRQMSLCTGSTRRVLAVLWRRVQAAKTSGCLSPGAARLFLPGRAARAARGLCGLSTGALRLFPPGRVAQTARGLRAFSPHAACLFSPRRVAQVARGLCGLSTGAVHLFPPQGAALAARGLAHSPQCGAPFPSAAPARATGRVSGSLQIGTGACLPGGRGWLLWG